MKPIPKAMVFPTSAVRVLSLMLLLSVALTARSFTVDGLNYTVSKGVATLTGAASRDITSLTIPATVTYGGTTYPVNEIHRKAFDNYTSLRKVHFAASDQPILCDQIQKFGVDSYFEADSPFDNCPIDEFIIERDHYTALSNGDVIADNVFLNTSSDNVSLSYTGKVKSIISSTINFKFFKPTQVTSVTIGCDSVKYFSNSSFNKCTNIKKISLLPGEYTIPSGAFPSGLTLDSLYLGKVCKSYPLSIYPAHVVFGEGWTSIPKDFFSRYGGNTSLQTVSLPEGLREIEDGAFNQCSNLSSINIPGSLKKIGSRAFSGCEQLSDVTLNEGLDSIGESAFVNCESFTRLIFPASLRVIDNNAFYGAKNVKSIFFEKSDDNAPVEIKENTIPLSVDSLVLNRPVNSRGGCLPAHVVFGEGWTSIPQGFFSIYGGNTSLQTVSLPEGLCEIEDGAFLQCSSLSSINFPKSIKKIGSSAFDGCAQLTDVTLNEGLDTIGHSSFSKCESFTRLIFPASLRVIDNNAFYGAKNVKSIFFEKSADNAPVEIKENTIPLSVDSLVLNRPVNSRGGCLPAHVVFGEGWTSIPQGFFSIYGGNTSLQTVSLPEGLCEIEDGAFLQCSSLSSINIPGSLKKIGDSAFSGCVQLTDVTLNEGLDSIGESAFVNCESFTRLNFPASLRVIDNNAFSGAKNVKSIFFEKSADNARVEIKENTIPLFVDSLVLNRPVNSRGGCLPAHVVFGEGWTSIPQGFFSRYGGNTSLQTVSLPEGLREIGISAFYRCSSLSSINFPASLKKIGSSAFDGCGQLLDVRTAATEPPVCDGSNVFSTKTYNDATLTVPAGRKKTYRGAEVWKLFKNVQSEGGGFKVTVAYDSQYGQVTLNGSDATEIAVDEDEPLTVAITAAEGYRVTRLSINGEDKTASLTDNRLAFESIDTNMAFEVEFGIITYTLTLPETMAGGHISVNGLAEAPASIDHGTRLELTAVADRGHKLDVMTVNGTDVTASLDQSLTYVIERVTENVEVTAAFSPITYTITAVNTTAKYGELTLNGQTGNCTVEFGNPLAIDVAPNEGCYLVRLTVDGVDVTDSVADGKYTVETVEADMTVEAVFAIHTYTIDLSFDPTKGTILFDRKGSGTTVTVEHGDELRLTIVPAEGYETAAVSLDGKDVTGQLDEYGVLTLANISSDHTVAASFDIKRVRLNVLGLEGGRIAMRYDYGTEVTLFIEPEDGWEFHSLTVGDMTITELEDDGSYTTPALTDHTDVSVVFKLKGQGGIDNAADRRPVTVSARQRTVTVEGADEGSLVEIFDTAGMTVYRGTEHVITLNRQGVHIVRVSGLTFKVMLR